jgi:hypothetical protein
MARSKQICVRLDSAERERLTRVATHYAMNDAGVLRHLLWQADASIAAGAKPALVRPDFYACEKLGITEAELDLLIQYKYLSRPPQKEEVDSWLADITLRTPQAILKLLARLPSPQ